MNPISTITKWLTALGSLALSLVPAAQAVQPVLQRGYDPGVSGATLTETSLNTSNVAPNTFGLVFKLPVDDAVFAQPLYVPDVAIPNKGVHNVLYVATMSDTLYAFDADAAGAPLWSVNLATLVGAMPVPIAQFVFSGNKNIIGNLGILSTPVIDASTNIMYLVAGTLENGALAYRLHAVDITTGTEPHGPGVLISGSYGGQQFDARYLLQRVSLTLSGNQVVFAFSAVELESANTYAGWVMAYDKRTLQQSGSFATVTTGNRGGGVWQSGRPPVVDGSGYVYAFVGNAYGGGYDGVHDFSESALKLDPANSLRLVDWFTPDDWSYLDANDLDLSSSGPLLIPGTSLLAGGGKAGELYVLDTADLGKYNANNGQIVQDEGITSNGGEMRGGPVYWQRSAANGGPVLYNWSSSDSIKAYAFNGTRFGANPSAQGSGSQNWPGGILALSANGDQPGSGVLWATVAASGDAENNPPVPGTLHAFDAVDVSNELWNSTMNASRDSFGRFAKFVPPLVANGKVYVATWSNQVAVYGLLLTYKVSPTSLAFGNETLNVPSAPMSVTVTNTGTVSLPITSITLFDAEPQPVLADQYLRDVGCGRSQLHDQRGVQCSIRRLDERDAERQRGQRCRDADGDTRRNRCGTELQRVAGNPGIRQRDDQRGQRANVGYADQHRPGAAAHLRHHAVDAEPQPVLADQYLRDVGRGRSQLHDQRGVQSSIRRLDERDAERQRGQRCRDADGDTRRNRCGTELQCVAGNPGIRQRDDQRGQRANVGYGDQHRPGAAAHHQHCALVAGPQPILANQYLRHIGRGRPQLHDRRGIQSHCGGVGERDSDGQRRREGVDGQPIRNWKPAGYIDSELPERDGRCAGDFDLVQHAWRHLHRHWRR